MMSLNKVIVSHTSDLDGRISRELFVFHTKIPENTQTIWIEYGELMEKAEKSIKKWATKKDVVILDFAISQNFLEKVAEVANSVELFDHHTGSTKLIAPANATLHIDTAESTVSLLQKHFTGAETLFTNICREIDLNLIENPSVLTHKLYFESWFMNKSLKPHALQLFLYESVLDPIYFPHWNGFEEYEETAKKQLETAKNLAVKAIIDKEERTALIERDERHKGIDTDILAHFMLRLDVDFALISFEIKEQNRKVTSVRKLKRTKRSLEDYCIRRGGGGRETAGAFSEEIKDGN